MIVGGYKLMEINQQYPKLDPHGFLERAFLWLDSDNDIGVFYAALDLRFTFEKILIKHGFASTNYSKSFEKNNWRPKKLYDSLGKEFAQSINLDKTYSFYRPNGNSADVYGYFLPIPQDLFDAYGQLNGLLHAQWAIPIGLNNDKWRKEKSECLRAFAERLVPHANPKNSLDLLSLPNISYKELKALEAEEILKKDWHSYYGV